VQVVIKKIIKKKILYLKISFFSIYLAGIKDDDSYCFVLLVEISLIALETKVQGPSDSPKDGWVSQCPIVRGGRISYGTSFPYLCIDYRLEYNRMRWKIG
jgi:hypothetical protein